MRITPSFELVISSVPPSISSAIMSSRFADGSFLLVLPGASFALCGADRTRSACALVESVFRSQNCTKSDFSSK